MFGDTVAAVLLYFTYKSAFCQLIKTCVSRKLHNFTAPAERLRNKIYINDIY